MDSVRAGPFGQLFRPDNFVFGQTGAGNNWESWLMTPWDVETFEDLFMNQLGNLGNLASDLIG